MTTAGADVAADAAVDAETDAGSFRWRPFLVASLLYLLGSVLVWWNVWTSSPSAVTTCGCGDSALFLWFLEWPAHALSHGLSPLFSTAMSYPHGTNLLANTSELGFGLPLVPITWLFGPVATFNVSLLLAPLLSAMAMYVLAARWVRWAPAAFVAGALYGFSSMSLVALSDGHLMVGMAAVPPLVVACLDELLVRQRSRPVLVGLALGLLVTFQFFIGTEVLLITALTVGVVLVLVLLGCVRHRDLVRQRAHHALVGLGTGALVALALLAYPAWFALAGPAHISGPVWPTIWLGIEGATLKGLFVPTAPSASFLAFTHRVGGSQGATLSGQYLGWGIAVVCGLGLVVWWRDRRMWLLGILSVLTAWTSLGVALHHVAPWNLLGGRPLFENIIPSRFLIMTFLTTGAMAAIVIDRSRAWAMAASAPRRHATHAAASGSAVGPRVLGGALAGLVALAVVLEPASYLSGMLPIATQRVTLPDWFATVAPTLPAGEVLLVLPVPFAMIESSMAWQAVGGMHYVMVGGGGPDGAIERAGIERPGQQAIGDVSFSFATRPITPKAAVAVHRALGQWGVERIVIPDEPRRPAYDQIQRVTRATALFTLATGIAPTWQAHAWVWDLRAAGRPHRIPATAVDTCLAGAGPRGPLAVTTSTTCLLDVPAQLP